METYGNIEDKLHLPSDCCLDLGCLGCGEVGISGYCILFKTVHPFVVSWFMSFLWVFAECFIVVLCRFLCLCVVSFVLPSPTIDRLSGLSTLQSLALVVEHVAFRLWLD